MRDYSKPWSNEESDKIALLVARGLDWKSMCSEIPGRSSSAIRERWRYINMPESSREARREGIRRRRRDTLQFAKRSDHRRADVVYSGRPTPDQIAARDERLSISPRDYTAAFCGDPLPGFSALERRNA